MRYENKTRKTSQIQTTRKDHISLLRTIFPAQFFTGVFLCSLKVLVRRNLRSRWETCRRGRNTIARSFLDQAHALTPITLEPQPNVGTGIDLVDGDELGNQKTKPRSEPSNVAIVIFVVGNRCTQVPIGLFRGRLEMSAGWSGENYWLAGRWSPASVLLTVSYVTSR